MLSWPVPPADGLMAPRVVSGLSNIVAIGASSVMYGYDVVVSNDGALRMWDSRTGRRRSITGVSNVVAVASGSDVLALTQEGTVFEIDRPPIDSNASNEAHQHEGLSNVMAIAAGRSRCLALKRDGTVAVVLGDGFDSFLTPPPDLKNVIGIAAGDMFCLALKRDSQ